jgi:hypothetical protein
VREDAEKPASSLPPDPLSARIPIDIVLLMNEPEAAFQAAAFSRIDTSLSLAHASTLEMLDQALPKLSPRARLIGFSTSLIAPASALEAFSNGAYNFHPGPPSYPGNRPSAFACYAGEQEYGVTFHRMVPRVDEGEILDCEIFSIANCNTSHAIAILAYQRLARTGTYQGMACAGQDRKRPRPNTTPCAPSREMWIRWNWTAGFVLSTGSTPPSATLVPRDWPAVKPRLRLADLPPENQNPLQGLAKDQDF